jgi:hypothetical protein
MADPIDALFFQAIGPAFAGFNALVIRSEENPRPTFRYGFGGAWHNCRRLRTLRLRARTATY